MIRVLGIRVLVREMDLSASEGGIFIPDAVRRQKTFEVVGVGELADGVSVGDRVLIGEYDGTEIIMDGKPYRIVDDEEILARID